MLIVLSKYLFYNSNSLTVSLAIITSSFVGITDGNEEALKTSLLYARIVSKYIGSYYAELGGCDAIAFTAGVGENAAYLRRIIIDDISKAFGVFLDEELNNIRSGENRVISHQYSQIKVMVIPTNEVVFNASSFPSLNKASSISRESEEIPETPNIPDFLL